jgi:putative thioredoxin
MNYEIKDFAIDVIKASFSKPVLVDFWAEWCGPCRVLGPVLERLAEKSKGEWLLVKVNSDEHPELSAKYGIRSIPNVKLFHNGEVVNEFVGALPEPAIKQWMKKNIPSKFQDMLAHAEALITSGNENEARRILNDVLIHDSGNSRAKIHLARICLFEDSKKVLQLISDIEETSENAELINSLKTIAELINENNGKVIQETASKELFLEAVRFLKEKKFEQSLEKFIEIIRTDRFYADDIARKACVAIFKYLGEENEITLTYRRDFGRALYV